MGGSRSVMAALLLFGLPGLWAPGPAANKKGNQSYQKGAYQKASGDYARALEALPAEKIVTFNRGTALLGEKKMDEALAALVSATGDPRRSVQAPALYNAGNALFEGKKVNEALDAWKHAILADPNDENAKFNYELAKRQQEQQKKDQKNQKNQDKKNQQNQQQNQDQNQQQQQDQQNQQQQDQNQQQQDQQKPPQPQPASQMTKEQAERLLDALKANEKEMLKARLTSHKKKDVEKDW